MNNFTPYNRHGLGGARSRFRTPPVLRPVSTPLPPGSIMDFVAVNHPEAEMQEPGVYTSIPGPEPSTHGYNILALIDPVAFPAFATVASMNPATVQDIDVTEGLLLLPPLDLPEYMTYPDLVDICSHRQVGVVTPEMAATMRCSAGSVDWPSSEAVMSAMHINKRLLEMSEEEAVLEALRNNMTAVGLKSALSIHTLMVGLVQRWTIEAHIDGDDPDFGPEDSGKLMWWLKHFTLLETVHWFHDPHPGPVLAGSVENGRERGFIRGLEGLSVARYFGNTLGVALTGLNLAGLADRLAHFVYENNYPYRAESVGMWHFVDFQDVPVRVYDETEYILGLALHGVIELHFVIEEPPEDATEDEKKRYMPSEADMEALKMMVINSPIIDFLSITGYPSAGLRNADVSAAREPGFYLPPFQFALNERFPPLYHLHLWRYDWRHHSATDMNIHFDFRRLHLLALDESPVRWFLGVANLRQLWYLRSLRMIDSEWNASPSDARQASLTLSRLLSEFIGGLQSLELVCLYTDNVQASAIDRHRATLTKLVLRHPFGSRENVASSVLDQFAAPVNTDTAPNNQTPADNGTPPNNGTAPIASTLHIAATHPSTITTAFTAMQPRVYEVVDMTSDSETDDATSEYDAFSTTSEGTSITAPPTEDDMQVVATQGVQGQEDTKEKEKDADDDTEPFPALPQEAYEEVEPSPRRPVRGRVSPLVSRLMTVELDMDERQMEQGEEPAVLSRLARMPMLRSVALAVPSLLTSLNCVPKYDADLHNALGRMLFLVSQRQLCVAEYQASLQMGHRHLNRNGSSLHSPLEQITFYIDGFVPQRGIGAPPPLEPDTLHGLMATLVTNMAHEAIADHDIGAPSALLSRRPPLPRLALDMEQPVHEALPPQFASLADEMAATVDRSPGAHRFSFLQPHEHQDVHAPRGNAPAIATRGQELNTQRCIIAELIRPEAPPRRTPVRTSEPRDPEDEVSDDEDGSEIQSPSFVAQNSGPRDPSEQLKYNLYEEFADFDDGDGSNLTFYQWRDLRENQVLPRKRIKLPFVISFARAADLPDPRWEVLGLPIWP